ncbi:hypothetical protein AB751O23_BJ_00070 [Chlamydiales bacterium SCGC AB-751-O23]|jgi:hypothetical protein|nr:hypothetical protein AB751O23_BJ_00070 [Chlamydiales bacterium SCGC AB-751-O23]
MKIIPLVFIISLFTLNLLYQFKSHEKLQQTLSDSIDYSLMRQSQEASIYYKDKNLKTSKPLYLTDKNLETISSRFDKAKSYYPKNSRINLEILTKDPEYYSTLISHSLLKTYSHYLNSSYEKQIFKKDLDTFLSLFINSPQSHNELSSFLLEIPYSQFSKRFKQALISQNNSFNMPPLSAFVFISKEEKSKKICLFNTAQVMFDAIIGKKKSAELKREIKCLNSEYRNTPGTGFKTSLKKHMEQLSFNPKLLKIIDYSKGSNPKREDKTIILQSSLNQKSTYSLFILN